MSTAVKNEVSSVDVLAGHVRHGAELVLDALCLIAAKAAVLPPVHSALCTKISSW
jgi:hypothetical protein